MPYEFEVVNLLPIEETISPGAAGQTLNESESLVEADRIHTDAREFCRLPDVDGLCHLSVRINPGVTSRVKKKFP